MPGPTEEVWTLGGEKTNGQIGKDPAHLGEEEELRSCPGPGRARTQCSLSEISMGVGAVSAIGAQMEG